MKKTILFLIFHSLFFNSFAQNNLSNIHFQNDFKQFQTIIEKINPQLEIKRSVTNYNILRQIANYQKQIDTCTNIQSFINIIQHCLSANIDNHFYLTDSLIVSEITEREAQRRNFEKMKMIKTCFLSKSLIKRTHKILPVKYIDGKYFLINDITQANYLFSSGSEILECNHLQIDTFVKENIDNFINASHWDFDNQKFFNEYFYLTIDDNVHNLLIENELLEFSKNIVYTFENSFYTQKKIESIDNILYIKIPEMSLDSFYINELLKYQTSEIHGVIIDIRGNMGGTDEAWQKILSLILDADFEYIEPIYFRNTKLLKKEFGIKAPIAKNNNFARKYYLDFSQTNKIFKHENSLKYNGKIIVIQDRTIFSGASNFINAISQKENVFIIGQSSGWLLGYTSMPRIFSLKNTHISFVMPISIDIQNTKKISESYRNKIDFEIPLNLEYYQNIYSDKKSNDIIKNDILIQKAIDIISE